MLVEQHYDQGIGNKLPSIELHVAPQRGISLECLGPQGEDWEFVGVVQRIVFVGEVRLVDQELHGVGVADVALYPVEDQRYQDHANQRLVVAEIDVLALYLPPLLQSYTVSFD